jgi:DNA-binding NarL/FixJ family response regulator
LDELNMREPSTLPRLMEHLTRREAEIVGLIAGGRTNRQIAEFLVNTRSVVARDDTRLCREGYSIQGR